MSDGKAGLVRDPSAMSPSMDPETRTHYDQGWNDRISCDWLQPLSVGTFSYFTGWNDCNEEFEEGRTPSRMA